LLALAAVIMLAPALGCSGVQRRLTIRSNPPGARVYVDGYDIGTTPASTDFLYYGTREIKLVKDGYETLTVKQPMPAPWFQIPPLDFISDNLLPRELRDERAVAFNLQPQVVVPSEALLGRAEHLRQGAHLQATYVGPPLEAPGAAVGPPPQVFGTPQFPQGELLGPPVLAPQTLPPQGVAPNLEGTLPLPPPGLAPQSLPPLGSPPMFER
jgi:hypothetical protein